MNIGLVFVIGILLFLFSYGCLVLLSNFIVLGLVELVVNNKFK